MCESCLKNRVDVVATIPDELRENDVVSLCKACWFEAKKIGGFLMDSYPINVSFLKNER